MSYLKISMLDTQQLGLSGDILVYFMEVPVSILDLITDRLIFLWLFSVPPGKHSGGISNIPRYFQVTIS